MQISDFVDYEITEEGYFWIRETRHKKSRLRIDIDEFYIPNSKIHFSKMVNLFGSHLFGCEWSGEELNSHPALSPKVGKLYYEELLYFGDYMFDSRVVDHLDEKFIGEVLVRPLSPEIYARIGVDYERLTEVLSVVREKLYCGEIKGFENPENPSEIKPTHWAGELWDILIYNNIPHHRKDAMYNSRPRVYFSKQQVTGVLSSMDNDPNNKATEPSGISFSPYIQFAQKIAAELNITEAHSPKKETVIQHILENWPADCGDKSKNKINMIATMVRWPSHEIGGNTKSKSPKG